MKFKVTEAEFSALPAALQAEYGEPDSTGTRTAKVEGIDTGDNIKRALDEEKEKRRKAVAEAEALKRATEEATAKALKDAGDYKALFEQSEASRVKLAEEKAARDAADALRARTDHAKSIAEKLATDPARRDMLANTILASVELIDGRPVLKGENGAIVETATAEAAYRQKYPFLVDGSKSSGGGAPGGTAGAGGAVVITRAQLDGMTPHARADFFVKNPGAVAVD